jgi:hypothetical protein
VEDRLLESCWDFGGQNVASGDAQVDFSRVCWTCSSLSYLASARSRYFLGFTRAGFSWHPEQGGVR